MDAISHPLSLLVKKLQIHAALSETDRQDILALPFKLKTLEPQAYTVREGDPAELCGVLISGFAYRQKLTGDGARQIVALHIPGEPLDLQHLYLDVADHSVQTLTRADLAFVPRTELQKLARENASVGHAMMVMLQVEASISREWILNVGRRQAKERLAHVLCEFAIRLEAQGLAEEYGYTLPMTQETLADVLGMTPVHVNRSIKALEADGLITRNRRIINFPDWKRLRETADFNQRYLHLEQQEAGAPC